MVVDQLNEEASLKSSPPVARVKNRLVSDLLSHRGSLALLDEIGVLKPIVGENGLF
jgi:hypothetical protein